MISLAVMMAGMFFAQACQADDTNKNFLPVPGEVTGVVPVKRVIVPVPAAKTNSPPVAPAPVSDIRPHPPTKPSVTASNDWGAYNRDRATTVLLDGNLVAKSALTPLVGFLVTEHATLGDGKQTFTGSAFDIAKHKATTNKVATAMELRPNLWVKTNERVFLLNYQPGTLPGVLLRVYVEEVEALEGWRTFKVGVEPSFEDWKRLTVTKRK